MEDDFINQVLEYYHEKKWKELLDLNKTKDYSITRKLSWVWPSEDNLKLIKTTIEGLNLEGIISIGCGSGLLEWFLQQYSVGFEVNEQWWLSRYSSPQFIKLNFPPQPPNSKILNSNYALLFCYFNDGDAFKEYTQCYKGRCVIIIGPAEGAGRHTNPQPFNPDFGYSNSWVLYKSQEVRNTKDFIAIYIRNLKI